MKKWLCLVLIFTLPLFSGCWDRWEVDERGMVLGVGLDLLSAEEPEEISPRRVQVTLQLVEPGKVAGQMKEGGTGGQGEPFWNMVMESEGSTLEAIRKASNRVNREPYFEHLQVVVLGEELTKDGLEKHLDAFFRNSEVRKRVLVYATPATAKEVLDVKPRQEAVSSVYLEELQENQKKVSSIAPQVDLGRLARYIHEGRDYLIPRVIPGEGEVILSGSGVFKGNRLVSWLGEKETQGVRLVMGEIKGGTLTAAMPHTGQEDLFVYEFMDTTSSIQPVITEDKLFFKVEIKSEGRLVEHQGQASSLEEHHLEAMEERLARDMEQQALAAIKKVQEYEADIFGFGRKLEEKAPALWQELKGNWDQVFATLEVEVEAQVDIRRVGLTK